MAEELDTIELERELTEIKKAIGESLDLRGRVDQIEKDSRDLRRLMLRVIEREKALGPRPGDVSDGCARYMAALSVAAAARLGRFGAMSQRERDWALGFASEVLDVDVKQMTSSNLPQLVEYDREIVELISNFGTARRYGTVYPVAAATTQIPYLGAGADVQIVGTAGEPGGTIQHLTPTISLAPVTPLKYGCLVVCPTELDEDSVVPFGRWLARYIANRMARGEDRVFWLARESGDGLGGTSGDQGLAGVLVTQNMFQTSAASNTAGITAAELQATAAMVREDAALQNAAWYCHRTMHFLFTSFNQSGVINYVYDGREPQLFGFPVRWVPVLPFYTAANTFAGKIAIIFGDVSYMYLCLHGGLRYDVDLSIGFATDLIYYRALERFAVEPLATGFAAGLRLKSS